MTNILSLENESGLVSFFSSFGVQRVSAIGMAKSITHWVKHHGIPFAVSRLKDLKQQRIHFENSSSLTFVKSHKDLTPYGSFRGLWTNNSISFSESLSMLNVYTCQVSPRITHSQAKKFVDSVNYIGPDISDFLDVASLAKFSSSTLNKGLVSYGPITKWIRKNNKRAPTLVNGVLRTTPETELSIDQVITDFRDCSLSNRELLMRHKHVFSKSLYQCNNSMYLFTQKVQHRSVEMCRDVNPFEELNKPPIAGKIGQIQEKGLKLRSVANPFRILQHALFPLGQYLYSILKDLPTDCTFQQEKGFDFIKEKLNENQTMYAYDLSNATDRFPLSVQVQVVKDLIEVKLPKRPRGNIEPTASLTEQTDFDSMTTDDLILQLNLLQDISRGRWLSPELEFYSGSPYLQWKTGQPLGLYPSFGLFALTHNLLLMNISEEHDAGDCFRVLGDDVIISNALVARDYKKVLDKYGCKISEDKSIISDKFGEFAGKITYPDETLNVPKWQHFSTDNPYGPLNCIGSKGLTFVPHQHKKTVMFLSSLPRPHGLELNPQGISLEERIFPFVEILKEKNHDLQPVTDYKQSDADKESSVKDTWSRITLGIGGFAKSLPWLKTKESYAPRTLDQSARYTNDVASIEHFNAYIQNLSNWDFPTIEKPQSDITIDREVWKKPVYNLYKLKKMFRKPSL